MLYEFMSEAEQLWLIIMVGLICTMIAGGFVYAIVGMIRWGVMAKKEERRLKLEETNKTEEK